MVGKFPEFSRFSLIFFKKVPFSRFSRFSLSRTNPDNFILAVLEKMGLGSDFIQWARTLLNDQQSCVMNNGTTTGYCNLNRGTRQDDPLSAYLFALVIEVLFIIRESVDIRSLNLFGTEVKLTACADDTTIFLRNLSSLKVLLQTFEKLRECRL